MVCGQNFGNAVKDWSLFLKTAGLNGCMACGIEIVRH
jgi:hypothetical protein